MPIGMIDLIVIIKRENHVRGFIGINENLGVGYIQSYLSEKKVNSSIHVVFSDELCSPLTVFDHEPWLIGLSFYADNAIYVLQAAAMLKKQFPKVHISLGGPNVKYDPARILTENTCIDSIVYGDGEETFYQLALRLSNKESLHNCQGLAYRDNEGVIINKPGNNMHRLNELPFPNRDILMRYNLPYAFISGSRGCLENCAYCAAASLPFPENKRIISRTSKSIVDEMEKITKETNVRIFRFTDSTFDEPLEYRDKKYSIFDEIKERGIDVGIHIFSRPELFDEGARPLLKKAYQAGLECIYLGIESGNEIDLHLYNKKHTVNDSLRSLQIIREEGIRAAIGFINFNPYSTYDTLFENARFIRDSGFGHIFHLYQTRFEMIAGSQIVSRMKEDGLVDREPDYKTGFLEYRFFTNRINSLFKIIDELHTKTAVYFMDTVLDTIRIWADRNLTDEHRHPFLLQLNQIQNVKNQISQRHYDLFCHCLYMSKNNDSIHEIISYCNAYTYENLFDEYKQLYNLIQLRYNKMLLKSKMPTIFEKIKQG